jgi:hypothetical protein
VVEQSYQGSQLQGVSWLLTIGWLSSHPPLDAGPQPHRS